MLTLLSSLALVAFPWHTLDGQALDLRFVPPALLMLGAGPRYAGPVYALLLALGWRVDGAVSPAVVTALLTFGVSGLLWWRQRRLRWHLHEVALISAAATLPILLLPAERSLLSGAWMPLLLGNVLGFAGASWVLTSRIHLIRLTWQLHDLAHTDTLTGLSNRRQYERDLRLLPPGSHLVLLDLDHFKRVNDRYGHAAGDRALGVVGAVLGAVQNDQIQAYRIGGEEFALLIQGRLDVAAETLGEQVLFQVREARVTLPQDAAEGPAGERPTLRLTCSIGLAKLTDSRDHVGMFRRADEALHQSKQGGRDRLTIAEAGADLPWTKPSVAVSGPDPRPVVPPTRHIQVGSAQGGSHALWDALLQTMQELSEDRPLTHADHLRLLRSAVLAVPGAGAGTLSVLERGEFVVVAQTGFQDSVIGRAFGAAGQREWYGGRSEDALTGRPRMLSNLELMQADDQNMLVCDVQDIRANICVPVVVGAQVVAYLNIDSLERTDAFGAESLDMAGIFGRQLSALLTAQNRRAERQTLEQALSEVQGLAGQLQQAGTAQAALDVLVRQLHAALWADSVQLYSVSALGLDILASAGTAPPEQDSILPGQGLCWSSVERQQFLNVPAVRADVPGYTETLSGPHTLLLLPLQSPRSSETLAPEQLGGGEVWGLLTVTRSVARPFLAVDEACCARFAHLTERALNRLEREHCEAQARMHDTQPG
ncbi:GGDEF domain-containing protein [Deinococcus altitudinis]|uniref:GGDEF domain-containing protein n=1 Tax=Deinococcus altitudinis TaxID=468914 RepID=UPI003891D90B